MPKKKEPTKPEEGIAQVTNFDPIVEHKVDEEITQEITDTEALAEEALAEEQLEFREPSFKEALRTINQKRIIDLVDSLKKDAINSITVIQFVRNLGYKGVTESFLKDVEGLRATGYRLVMKDGLVLL